MKSINKRNLLATLGMAPFASGFLARASSRDFKPDKMSPRARARERYFPNVELTTHEGKKVRFYDDLIKDKIVVINFMYANCEGICPALTMNLAKVQKLLGERVGRDIFFYSITLKPEVDTPKALNGYAKMHGAGPGWLFLTGKPADIELLRRRLGFVDPDPEVDKDKSNHIGNLRIGNEPLILWSACPGMFNAEGIVKSIFYVDRPMDKQTQKVKAAPGGEKGERK